MKKRFNQDGGENKWQRMLERYWDRVDALTMLVGKRVRNLDDLAGLGPQARYWADSIIGEIDQIVGDYYGVP